MDAFKNGEDGLNTVINVPTLKDKDQTIGDKSASTILEIDLPLNF